MVVPKSVCLIEQGQTNGHSRVRLIVELQRVYPAFNRPRRIRGKIFVTVPPDEEHVHIFVGDDDRDPALALHPEFLEKLIWGGKVRGLRVRLSKASPSVVNQLRRAAWVRKAPGCGFDGTDSVSITIMKGADLSLTASTWRASARPAG